MRGGSGRCESFFLLFVWLYVCFFGRGRILNGCRWGLWKGDVELFVGGNGQALKWSGRCGKETAVGRVESQMRVLLSHSLM